jgi:hypothetical protein
VWTRGPLNDMVWRWAGRGGVRVCPFLHRFRQATKKKQAMWLERKDGMKVIQRARRKGMMLIEKAGDIMIQVEAVRCRA